MWVPVKACGDADDDPGRREAYPMQCVHPSRRLRCTLCAARTRRRARCLCAARPPQASDRAESQPEAEAC